MKTLNIFMFVMALGAFALSALTFMHFDKALSSESAQIKAAFDQTSKFLTDHEIRIRALEPKKGHKK